MQLRLRAGASPFSLAWLLFTWPACGRVELSPPDEQVQALTVSTKPASTNLLGYA